MSSYSIREWLNTGEDAQITYIITEADAMSGDWAYLDAYITIGAWNDQIRLDFSVSCMNDEDGEPEYLDKLTKIQKLISSLQCFETEFKAKYEDTIRKKKETEANDSSELD